MPKIDFGITRPTVTSDDIVRWRAQLTADLPARVRAVKLFLGLTVALVLTGCAMLVLGHPDSDTQVLVSALVLVMAIPVPLLAAAAMQDKRGELRDTVALIVRSLVFPVIFGGGLYWVLHILQPALGQGEAAGLLVVQLVILPASLLGGMAMWVGDRVDTVLFSLKSLEPLELEHCPQVLEWCQAHPEVARYQGAVAESGRMLVDAEFTAIKRWLMTREARASEARQLAACEALRRPVCAE